MLSFGTRSRVEIVATGTENLTLQMSAPLIIFQVCCLLLQNGGDLAAGCEFGYHHHHSTERLKFKEFVPNDGVFLLSFLNSECVVCVK
jgi:hypothetical protein